MTDIPPSVTGHGMRSLQDGDPRTNQHASIDSDTAAVRSTQGRATVSTLRAALVFPSLKINNTKIPTANEFAGEKVDFVLFPEGYINDKEHYKTLKKLALDLSTPLLVGANVRIDYRTLQSLVYFAPDGSEPYELYMKHSTAGVVAFDCDDWNTRNYLPTFELGGVQAGATICHDHYLGLLPRHLAKNGARLWLNPSYDNVLDAKWSPVLRLRAVENNIFALCTLHDDKSKRKTHPFAFSPDGNELYARKAGSTDKRLISNCVESDTIYVVDLDISSTYKQLDWSCLPRASNLLHNINKKPQKPVRVSLREGQPSVYTGSRWSDGNSTSDHSIKTKHGTVYIGIVDSSDILDAAVCFQIIDNAYKIGCHPIIWNHWDHLPTAEPDRMGNLLKGRVIECCAPIVISDKTGIRELVELSNCEKLPVRRPVKLSEAVIDVAHAFGMNSAFKMVTKHIIPPKKTTVLDMYRDLCTSSDQLKHRA